MKDNNSCKNCGGLLEERKTKRTAAQLKKPYYYTAYYYCPSCHKLYHDNKFKVENKLHPSLFSSLDKPHPDPLLATRPRQGGQPPSAKHRNAGGDYQQTAYAVSCTFP